MRLELPAQADVGLFLVNLYMHCYVFHVENINLERNVYQIPNFGLSFHFMLENG